MEKQNIEKILKEKLDFTDTDLENKEKLISYISYLTENTIEEKIKFYLEEFNLTKQEFAQLVKKLPSLLGLDKESIQEKELFYLKEFNLTKKEFAQLVKKMPPLLGYTQENVQEKELFYLKEFNLTKQEFAQLVKKMPQLLNFSQESVINKHKMIRELEFDDDVVIKNPTILSAPENSLKVRYMVLYIVEKTDKFIEINNWSMTSHTKTWARLCGLQEISSLKITAKDLILSEKQFAKKFKIDSKTLMERYHFTKKAVAQINAEYQNIAKQTYGLDLKISEEELGLR